MSKHKTRQIFKIINATLNLIHDEGLSRVSISKIAKSAGVTRQTIYNYFPDVESIIADAVNSHSKAVNKQLLETMEIATNSHKKLYAFAKFQISTASAEHENISLDVALSAKTRKSLVKHTAFVKLELSNIIAQGIEKGEFSNKIDPIITSELFWGMVEAAVNVAARFPNKKGYLIDALFDAMLAVLKV